MYKHYYRTAINIYASWPVIVYVWNCYCRLHKHTMLTAYITLTRPTAQTLQTRTVGNMFQTEFEFHGTAAAERDRLRPRHVRCRTVVVARAAKKRYTRAAEPRGIAGNPRDRRNPEGSPKPYHLLTRPVVHVTSRFCVTRKFLRMKSCSKETTALATSLSFRRRRKRRQTERIRI